MSNNIQFTLTRKLRQLMELQEIELDEAEAELYDLQSADHWIPEPLTEEIGEKNDE